MKKGILKLIQYLKSKVEKIESTLIYKAISKEINSSKGLDLLIDQEAVANNIIRLLTIPREEWANHGEIFISFDELSTVMKEAKLNSRETLEVINYMIEKNIATGITREGANFFDGKAIKEYPFQSMTPKEAEVLIKSDKYRTLIEKENPTEKEKLMIKELEEFIEKHPAEHNEIAESHKIMEEQYFNNKGSLTIENINEYLNQLMYLHLPIETAIIIKPVLLKQIPKEIEEIPSIRLNVTKPIKKESSATKKERYNLEQQLKQYVDLTNMKLINDITYDELIDCLSILKKLNYSEEKLNIFIYNYNKACKHKNPLIQYMELYYRYLYYKNPKTESLLDNLERCFKEMLLCSNEEYEIWKTMLEEYLQELNDIIPNTNEYELSLIK